MLLVSPYPPNLARGLCWPASPTGHVWFPFQIWCWRKTLSFVRSNWYMTSADRLSHYTLSTTLKTLIYLTLVARNRPGLSGAPSRMNYNAAMTFKWERLSFILLLLFLSLLSSDSNLSLVSVHNLWQNGISAVGLTSVFPLSWAMCFFPSELDVIWPCLGSSLVTT